LRNSKKILVAPLDWGLGHTSRCVPIILALQKAGVQVVCAGTPNQIAFLQEEVQQVQFLPWKGYGIRYAKSAWATLLILVWQMPKIALRIWQEHRELQSLIDKENIDAVISDNRYGLWTKKVPCVFITHQLQIPVPMGKKMINWWNHYFINQYNVCWLPDEGLEFLSGLLSKLPIFLQEKVQTVGFLSRLEKLENSVVKENSIALLLGGPEPQRGLLQQCVQEQMANTKYTLTVIGSSQQVEKIDNPFITYLPIVNTKNVETLLQAHDLIIARSGYSSLMDLAAIGKSAIIIPTPGQAEQQYLAEYCSKKKWHMFASQNNFSLENSKLQFTESKLVPLQTSKLNLLQAAIQHLLLLCK
jgi:UDP-N-acetylglucosamine:LPS N-acetylglucosamine transferase